MDVDGIKRLLENPTTLQDILDFREYTYSMLTREAIKLFGPTLTGAANRYLNNTAEIDWTAIELIDTLEGYVRVTGFFLPTIGSMKQHGSCDPSERLRSRANRGTL